MSYIDGFLIGADEYDLVDTATIDNICTNVEDGSVASKTYNAGDYILRNGQLHRVTQTIASGSAITEGVNIESATVGNELSVINSNLSKKNIDNYVDIINYTNSKYEFETDGYVRLYSGGSSSFVVDLFGNNESHYFSVTNASYQANAIMVKKGMKIRVISAAGSNELQFYPFI